MAELKHTFTSGRMNKDLDDRLVPNGEYIDALNIQVSSSEGSDVGAIENLLGNEQLSDLGLNDTTAKTIGSIADTKNNKIYWLVTSDDLDAIYEFDEKTKLIKLILSDYKFTQSQVVKDVSFVLLPSGELGLENKIDFNGIFAPTILPETCVKYNVDITVSNPEITISIPKNTVILKNDDDVLEFKNIPYKDKEYGGLDVTFTYTTSGFLNFSKNNLVTGINIIDGLLFWTDNLNQPRRINISEFSSYKIIQGESQVSYKEQDPNDPTKTITLTRPITEDDITVVKKAPKNAPVMDVFNTLIDGNTKINSTLDFKLKTAGQEITVSSISNMPIWEIGDSVLFTTPDTDTTVEASILTIGTDSIVFVISNIQTDDSGQAGSFNYLIELIEPDPIYELEFVRFGYRWKYKNGEYSVFSPFTVPAFYPRLQEFRYDGKEAFNFGMVNQTRKITLTDFDLGSDEVEEIDIIFKETKNNNIYTLLTKKKLEFPDVFTITKEQIHSVIENSQLLRQWDNVPLKAKAQEITANRVIYGNYTQNYSVYKDPDFNIKVKSNPNKTQKTIKSNRNYQLGIVYSDEYNRQTPVFSNDSGAVIVPKKRAPLENQLAVSMANTPPAWATHFRYFIKDSSAEYYNLAADRFYEDSENGFTYISFPSAERNKVTQEHYLLLKKRHGNNEYVSSENNRYKIIDISSDPPEFITSRKRLKVSLGDVVFTDDYSGSGGGTTITNKSNAENNAPIKDFASIQIKQANGSSNGVELTDTKEIQPGRYISFQYADFKPSKPYKIKKLSQHPSGANEIKIDFEDPFGEDVEVIYNRSTGNVGDPNNNQGVDVNILEEFTAAGDKEFDGRFFIKLKTNATLANAVFVQTVGGKSYLAKASVNLIGIYSDKDENGRGRGGANTYRNVNRIKNSAGSDPRNKVLVTAGGTKVPGSTEETGKRYSRGSLQYQISLEASTHRVNNEIIKLRKLSKVGNFVRFVNFDGTPHHDHIYEIGGVLETQISSKMGGNAFTSKGDLKQLHYRFIDADGNPEDLQADVCTRGQDTWDAEPQMEILQERDEENEMVKEPSIFETEPLPSKTDLNIYFEASDIYDITKHDEEINLDWYNAITFKNGVESNRIRDDFNAVFIDNGVKASTVLNKPYRQEHKFNGIIYSGIINSRSGVNRTNEFNMANSITKDLLPSYGSIQKFHAWDDSMVILCEDKSLRVYANKSALYNADGSSNLISDSRVIGDPIEYNGVFGIGVNPESFASYGFRCYFADKSRGVVLRLSKDGLTPISAANMGGFFEERLAAASTLLGSYDSNLKVYNLSFAGLDTVCYSEDVQGWVSRLSFIPENAVYLNNIYYTYNAAELWQQHSPNVKRNNFYGTQHNSNVEFIINDNPSVIKKFKTLGYEGTSGWIAKTIKTDQVTGNETSFKPKENKYFANITQEKKLINTLDQKNFSAQGIGKSIAAGAAAYSTQVGSQTFDKFNVKLSNGTSFSSDQKNNIIIKTDTSIDDIQITIRPISGYIIKPSDFNLPSNLITLEKSNNNVIATIDGSYLESFSPTNGQTINITITARTVLAPVTVSGTGTTAGFNFTDNVGNTSFKITDDPNTKHIINKRVISPDSTHSIDINNISVDNALIKLNKTKLPNGDILIKESIVIPSVNSTNINYVITITPTLIIIPDKQIFSSLLNNLPISNDGETRDLVLTGEVGAKGEVTLSYNSTSNIFDVDFTTDTFSIPLVFPAGDTSKTFTIKIETKGKTIFGSNFGSETITLSRPARTRNTISFEFDAKDLVTSANRATIAPVLVEGYSNDEADFDFKQVITLNGTGYSVKKIPTFSDVTTYLNSTGTNIEFTNFTIASATNDTLTIEAKLTSDDFNEDNFFTLDLSDHVTKNVTVTFAYSSTPAAGGSTSNYSVTGYKGASVPYTITAAANSLYTTPVNYYFTLTASSNYKPKSTFTNLEPFKIYDSSNNDVTSLYSSTGKVAYGKQPGVSSPSMNVGFKNIPFVFPSSNQTFTIRPVEEVFAANTGVEIRALILFPTQIKASGFDVANGGLYSGKGAIIPASTKWNDRKNYWAGINQIDNHTGPQMVIRRHPTSSALAVSNWNTSVNQGGNAAEYNTGRYWITDGTAGNKLLQHIMTINDDLFYWWDTGVTDTNKYNLTNLGSYFSKASAGTYTDIFGATKSITGTFEVSNNGKTLTTNMVVNFNNTAVGQIVYHPELLTTFNNDYPNYFNKFDIKQGHTAKHITSPCSLITDTATPFLKLLSNDSVLADGSLVYERDNRGNLQRINNLHFNYIKDNPTLFKTDDGGNYPTGHYNFIQGQNPLKFTNTKCPISTSKVGLPTPQVTYKGVNQGYFAPSPSPNGADWRTWWMEIDAGAGFANQKIKITGQYYDQRFGNYGNIGGNKLIAEKADIAGGVNNTKTGYINSLGFVTTTDYPKGVPSDKAVEKWAIKDFKITNTLKNEWEAEVQLDAKGKGKLTWTFQMYSNMSIAGLYMGSDQVIDEKGNTMNDAYNFRNGYTTTFYFVAQKPQWYFTPTIMPPPHGFQGNFRIWRDWPENPGWPTHNLTPSIGQSFADYDANINPQWTAAGIYRGDLTLGTKIS